MVRKNQSVALFLIGLFSMAEIHIGGFIGISELVLFLCAPFMFLMDINLLRRDGFMPMICLSFLAMGGCLIASWVNHTPMPIFLKGIMSVYSIFACLVCLHRLLREDFGGLKWIIVGYCLSLVVNIFIFQRGSSRRGGDVAIMSAAAMENTANSVLFWAQRGVAWLQAPIQGWYEKIKKWYAVPSMMGAALLCLFASGGSGRSAALCAALSACLLAFGSSSVKAMRSVQKNLWLVIIALLCCAFCFKRCYQQLARSGSLGEAAYKKYEEQTKRGRGWVSLIMGGRIQFFAGAYAGMEKPIVGYGPWAIDWDGIYGDFLARYGTEDDYLMYQMDVKSASQKEGGGLSLIPTHSYLIGFWIWYGIFGLLIWVYVLWLIFKVFFRWLIVYPPWFGYLACVIPLMVWNIFFSPFGARIMTTLTIVVCLFIKAVANGRLPYGGANWPRSRK